MCEAHKTRDELLAKGIVSPEDNYCADGKISDRYETLDYVNVDFLIKDQMIVSELDRNKGQRLSLFKKVGDNYQFQHEHKRESIKPQI